MIKEDFVSFETAKLLKEKGFDEYCSGYYKFDKSLGILSNAIINNSALDDDGIDISAPTLQMAMKWLREEKNYHIMIDCHGTKNWLPTIQHTVGSDDYKIEGKVQKISGNGFDSYEEAVVAALKYCLTILI